MIERSVGYEEPASGPIRLRANLYHDRTTPYTGSDECIRQNQLTTLYAQCQASYNLVTTGPAPSPIGWFVLAFGVCPLCLPPTLHPASQSCSHSRWRLMRSVQGSPRAPLSA